MTVIVIVVIGIAVCGWYAYQMLTGPITCGGEPVTSGSSCVDLDNGATYSSGDLAGAPVRQPWFWAVVIGGLVLTVSYQIYKRLVPSRKSAAEFLEVVVPERLGLQAALRMPLDDATRARLADYGARYDAALAPIAARLKVALEP